MILLDASGSMADLAGTHSRWEMAREALAAFLADDRSSGLGVGLQIFPLHTFLCQDDGDCFLPSPGGCVVFGACVAPGAPLASGRSCGSVADQPCPAGAACTPMGRCSMTGGDCLGVGQPCASGVAGDVCGARPRQCRLGPTSRGSCKLADYQTPMVPITDLPGNKARLIGAMDTRLAVGGTPLAPAVKGVIAHLQARPDNGRRAVMVLVSDGVPSGCGEVAEIAADLRAALMSDRALSTYVVGVFADGDPPEGRATMMQLAAAGGTGTPFIVSANEQLTEKFLAALSQIRGASVPCDLAIPAPASGMLDFGRVNVHVDGKAGASDLVYVGSSDRCGLVMNGWYYDVDPAMGAPRRVLLCPATCDKLKADPQAAIDVRFGCQTIVIK
jgi:hypothetical protein